MLLLTGKSSLYLSGAMYFLTDKEAHTSGCMQVYSKYLSA